MSDAELQFRKDVSNPRKKVAALNDFAEYLLEKEHILEASHYSDLLLSLKPSHIKSLTLAYRLAIRRFDYKRVPEIDQQIEATKISPELLFDLRLRFLFSMNAHARENMEKCIDELLQFKKLPKETEQLLIDAILFTKDYRLAEKLIAWLKRSNKIPIDYLAKELKKIALQALVNRLAQVRK